jgi:DNA helicase-2/ATP-dependent DNA helicase PcrA
MLQRIAYLFYQERLTLTADKVVLFTPNGIFSSYIDSVLPQMGEANPHIYTWRTFTESAGLYDRDIGADTSPEDLLAFERAVPTLEIGADDLADIRIDGELMLTATQAKSCLDKFAKFP